MHTVDEIKFMMGKNLARLRKLKGWTQEDLASKINSSASHISQMESGRGIGSDMLATLCNLLNASPADFYSSVIYRIGPSASRVAEDQEQYGPKFDIRNDDEKEVVTKLLDILHGNNQQGAYALKLIIGQTWMHKSEKKGVTVSEISKKEVQKA